MMTEGDTTTRQYTRIFARTVVVEDWLSANWNVNPSVTCVGRQTLCELGACVNAPTIPSSPRKPQQPWAQKP